MDVPLPIQRMTWQEAMDRFGSDKPDTRFGMELNDVTDVVRDCEFAVFKNAIADGGSVRGINAKGQEMCIRDRNMLDFSDLEHYMLQLLADFSEDEQGQMQVKPTSAADELSEFYEEVVCDEYQDSNQVQELILSLLSRERKGQYNRFMVGDVKQSIYRFRLADAAIFMEKYRCV